MIPMLTSQADFITGIKFNYQDRDIMPTTTTRRRPATKTRQTAKTTTAKTRQSKTTGAVKAEYEKDRETKNKVRYAYGDETIYVPKEWFGGDIPDAVTVTITPVR